MWQVGAADAAGWGCGWGMCVGGGGAGGCGGVGDGCAWVVCHVSPGGTLGASSPRALLLLAGLLHKSVGPNERHRVLRWEERLAVTQSSLATQVCLCAFSGALCVCMCVCGCEAQSPRA